MSNIVHFGKYYFPEAGGIESVTSSLAKGAVKLGHQVTVVCFKKKDTVNTAEIIDQVRVVRAPIKKIIASQPLGFGYLKLCLKEGRKADIVHLHAPNMLAALCCLLIGQKPRLLVHWHSDVIGKGLLGRILKPLETALLKRADWIVATSQIYADASPALKPFLSKVSVVPIGVADPQLLNDNDSVIECLPIDIVNKLKNKRLILAVGRLVPYKGFNVLIEAAKFLNDDIIVMIVGIGPLQDFLHTMVERHGVAERVYLTGRLSDDVLHALFNRADLYCMPSVERSEAFGVVLLEAMAYGLPIIATNIPGSGVPWVNQHDVSGINVAVGNATALANACNEILLSEDKYLRLSKGSRQRFVNEFTEDVSVKRMLDTYRHFFSELN